MSTKLADQVMLEARQWLEATLALPDGDRHFQGTLMRMLERDISDIPGIARCLGLAHAAITIADQDKGHFAGWYREQSQRLMHRALLTLSLLDAAPAGAAVN